MVLALAVLAPRVQSNIGLIRGGVNRGMSSTQIQSLIRSTGQAGIRRTDLLAGIRQVQGITESANRIRSVRRDRFPDPSRIAVSKGPMVSRFSYDVRFAPKGWRAGDPGARYITVRSDRNLRPMDILSEAEEARDTADPESESGKIEEEAEVVVIGARRKE